MKIYIPQGKEAIGGGWTFLRNFRQAISNKVHFVNSIEDCDIFFLAGVTIAPESEIYQAKKLGKPIVFRVDNVPRKSRNKRCTPHERMKEYAELADVVVYQSEWAKQYCFPLTADGTVIYNGVNTSIFKPNLSRQNTHRYMFAYHGKSELKQFWLAHLIFQRIFRSDPAAEFWFIYDFGRDLPELEESRFDFWNGEKYAHLPKAQSAEEMAGLLQQCRYFIYPSVADASPNVVLEARACGCEVIFAAPKEWAGTEELLNPTVDVSAERMAEEYLGVFKLLLQDKQQENV